MAGGVFARITAEVHPSPSTATDQGVLNSQGSVAPSSSRAINDNPEQSNKDDESNNAPPSKTGEASTAKKDSETQTQASQEPKGDEQKKDELANSHSPSTHDLANKEKQSETTATSPKNKGTPDSEIPKEQTVDAAQVHSTVFDHTEPIEIDLDALPRPNIPVSNPKPLAIDGVPPDISLSLFGANPNKSGESQLTKAVDSPSWDLILHDKSVARFWVEPNSHELHLIGNTIRMCRLGLPKNLGLWECNSRTTHPGQ